MPHPAPSAEKPLTGLSVLVTRPAEANDVIVEQLVSLGASVVAQPAIRIGPPSDWTPVDAALKHLHDFDWLVFASANGVRYLFDRMKECNVRPLWWPLLAVMGSGTAEELIRCGRRPDLVPEQYRAESLADALAADAAGKRFLLVRASRGRNVLAERLMDSGAKVEQIVVYTSEDVERPEPSTTSMLRDGRINWITVTSSAIARSLARLFGDDLCRAKLASISPITSETLRELGFEPAAEATEHTMAGLTAALVAAVERRPAES